MTLETRSVAADSFKAGTVQANNGLIGPLDVNVFRIMYVSECARQTGSQELRELAEQAVRNNYVKGITGILLLIGNVFFQILEGEEFTVSHLINLISKDSRHYRFRIVHKEYNVVRAFGQWSMGSVNLNDEYDLDYKGYRTLRSRIDKIVNEQRGTGKAFVEVVKALPAYLERRTHSNDNRR